MTVKTFLFVAMWILAVGIGSTAFNRYSYTPGASSHVPGWPANASVTLSQINPTLILTLHPECGCSRATVAELRKIISQNPDRLSVVALVVDHGLEEDINKNSLVKTVASFANTQIVIDPTGLEAKKFGAETSGQALLFDSKGMLLFSGGLTESRGHEGPNAGADAVSVALNQPLAMPLNNQNFRVEHTPVFGCELFDKLAKRKVASFEK